jgi:hypothetical protein
MIKYFMQSKSLWNYQRLSNYRRFSTTSGFVQLGHDVAAIIGSAYPGFGFGGRNSAGQ